MFVEGGRSSGADPTCECRTLPMSAGVGERAMREEEGVERSSPPSWRVSREVEDDALGTTMIAMSQRAVGVGRGRWRQLEVIKG